MGNWLVAIQILLSWHNQICSEPVFTGPDTRLCRYYWYREQQRPRQGHAKSLSCACHSIGHIHLMFLWMRGFWVGRSRHRTYPSTSSKTRTGMSYCIVSFAFHLRSFTVLKVFAIWLEGRYNVKLLCSFMSPLGWSLCTPSNWDDSGIPLLSNLNRHE